MATWHEYITNLRNNIITTIPSTMERTVATNAIALIRYRIATRGEKAEGGQFRPYSTRPILVGATSFVTKKAAGKVFGSAKKRRGAQWRTVRTPKGPRHLVLLPGGYAEIRRLEGRQVAHKDFERTSAMWKSIHVLGQESPRPGVYSAVIGSRVPLTNRKLSGLGAHEGAPILALSDREMSMLTAIVIKKIQELI